ncbi:MAG: prolyl oligopeptidase family serine peptidase [Armatimonadetes bacterium]|nr:prolyl oligopeptidase family serine peptidase [Armatimonadota bacterium]
MFTVTGVWIAPESVAMRRSLFNVDRVQRAFVESGSFVVSGWATAKVQPDGGILPAITPGRYVVFEVTADKPTVIWVRPKGGTAFFDGTRYRPGDVYSDNTLVLPVALPAGTTRMAMLHSRGFANLGLQEAPSDLAVNLGDLTLPDIRQGEKGRFLAGVTFVNSTGSGMAPTVEVSWDQGPFKTVQPGKIPPYSFRKLPVPFNVVGNEATGAHTLRLRKDGKDLGTVTINVVSRTSTFRRTFISGIDSSVQYYAVNPPQKEAPGKAMVLSLHGASVEASGQAPAYGSKDWAYIVAATNRRPFGFNWETIGRRDAIEVLDQAEKLFKTDPERTYLTGHSMGGHGTWHVGSHFPGRFAAIGASAGWQSFWTYADKPRANPNDKTEVALEELMIDSDPIKLVDSYKRLKGIYIIHGDADDNVPLSEAQRMEKLFQANGIKYQIHVEPKAGHWWDNSPEPGADCVDWKPMFEMFKSVQLDKVDKKEVRLGPAVWSDVYDNRVVFVLPSGTDRVSMELANKAAFDAEALGYRGNASIELVQDKDVAAYRGRNMVIYGSRENNRAYDILNAPKDAGVNPTVAKQGRLGTFVQGKARMGWMTASDIEGARTLARLPLFSPGMELPPSLLVNSDILVQGTKGIVSLNP